MCGAICLPTICPTQKVSSAAFGRRCVMAFPIDIPPSRGRRRLIFEQRNWRVFSYQIILEVIKPCDAFRIGRETPRDISRNFDELLPLVCLRRVSLQTRSQFPQEDILQFTCFALFRSPSSICWSASRCCVSAALTAPIT